MTTGHATPAKYHFDRAKPFYPLVMSYLMQLHSIKELAALGALGTKRRWDLGHLSQTEPKLDALKSAAAKLLGPLELLVTGDDARLSVPVEFVAQEFLENHQHLILYQIQAALNVLVMAHEVTKNKEYRSIDEKWEFLRHCRNAAAHNGRWHFLNGEPRNPASWRQITLSPTLHDCPLLIGQDGIGSLRIGDPVALLWDIEQDSPAMRL